MGTGISLLFPKSYIAPFATDNLGKLLRHRTVKGWCEEDLHHSIQSIYVKGIVFQQGLYYIRIRYDVFEADIRTVKILIDPEELFIDYFHYK